MARSRLRAESPPVVEGASVFVSYSRQDSIAVSDLVARLHAQSLPVWMDTQNIEGGEMWATSIATAIRQCRVVILMVSPSALDSPFVRKEVALATAQAKPVVPVLVRPCELHAEWELATAGVQRINLVRSSAASATADILRALAHHGVCPASSTVA